jgi:hypothetical protein
MIKFIVELEGLSQILQDNQLKVEQEMEDLDLEKWKEIVLLLMVNTN